MEKTLHIAPALPHADPDRFLNPGAVPAVTRLVLDVEVVSGLRNPLVAGIAPGTVLPVNDLVLDAAATELNRNC